MQTYESQYLPLKSGLRIRIAVGFFAATVYFAIWFGKGLIWPSETDLNASLASRISAAAIFGIAMGFFQGIFYRPPFSKPSNIRLTVDDESITSAIELRSSLMKWKLRRTVRKGRIKSVFEVRGRFGSTGGIGVSERRKFAARVLGYAFIPRSLENFDELKQIVESWREPASDS